MFVEPGTRNGHEPKQQHVAPTELSPGTFSFRVFGFTSVHSVVPAFRSVNHGAHGKREKKNESHVPI